MGFVEFAAGPQPASPNPGKMAPLPQKGFQQLLEKQILVKVVGERPAPVSDATIRLQDGIPPALSGKSLPSPSHDARAQPAIPLPLQATPVPARDAARRSPESALDPAQAPEGEHIILVPLQDQSPTKTALTARRLAPQGQGPATVTADQPETNALPGRESGLAREAVRTLAAATVPETDTRVPPESDPARNAPHLHRQAEPDPSAIKLSPPQVDSKDMLDRLLAKEGSLPTRAVPPADGASSPSANSTTGSPAGQPAAETQQLNLSPQRSAPDLHLANPAFNRAIGERILWMVSHHQQTADVRVNPPELGAVEIRVEFKHDQTSVSFVTQHAAVKEAIESAIPRLREMFAGEGLNLADVNVSHQNAERREDTPEHATPPGADPVDQEGKPQATAVGVPADIGLIDAYA